MSKVSINVLLLCVSISTVMAGNPWWCNAAVSKCINNKDDSCCRSMWSSQYEACVQCQNLCPGRGCVLPANPWWCNAAADKCFHNKDDSCCRSMWTGQSDACLQCKKSCPGRGCEVPANPWWCNAAVDKCFHNKDDSCCRSMWTGQSDACLQCKKSCPGRGCEVPAKPWWCNAAVDKCSNNKDDSCCTSMWSSQSDACKKCQNSCPGRNCIQWQSDGWAQDCDFNGGDFKNVPSKSSQCGGICEADSQCTHFTWSPHNDGTCWMKSGEVTKSQAFYSSGKSLVCGITGPKKPNQSANPWWCNAAVDKCSNNKDDSCCTSMWSSQSDACKKCQNSCPGRNCIQWQSDGWAQDCDFNGGDFKNVPSKSSQCGGICEADSQCTHFTWSPHNDGTCWMKSGEVTKSQAFYSSGKSLVCGITGPKKPNQSANPWWCNAAVDKCSNNKDDSCCTSMWSSQSDACKKCQNSCLGRNCIQRQNDGRDTSGDRANWLSGVSNEVMLYQLNIPGTHDSATAYQQFRFLDLLPVVGLPATSNWWKTVDDKLSNQYDKGIRFVDIRCRHYMNSFPIHHGEVFLDVFFDQVLAETITWLKKHPTEFIIMSVKPEHTEEDTNSQSFEATFNSYINAQGRNNLYLENRIPSVGMIRGKIVILKRFGSKGDCGIDFSINDDTSGQSNGLMFIQDNYKASNGENKCNVVRAALDSANNPANSNLWYFHFLNMEPGFRVIRDWACTINNCFLKYMNERKYKRFGTIIMDYPFDSIINSIIYPNFQKFLDNPQLC